MTTQSDQKNPVHSPRKGAKTGVVSELSVFLKVKPGHEKQIREVFTRMGSNKRRTAKVLGIARSTLDRKLGELGGGDRSH